MAISLDKLLFQQGGNCFFCKQPLLRLNASVEHLVAKSKGGADTEDNCVACCQQINQLLGNASIKAKMQIVLNHNGNMRCPTDIEDINIASEDAVVESVLSNNEVVRRRQRKELQKYNRVNSVLARLRAMTYKPATMSALLNFIKTNKRFGATSVKSVVIIANDLLNLKAINLDASGDRLTYLALQPRHPPEPETKQEVEIAELFPTDMLPEDFGSPLLPEFSEEKKAELKQDSIGHYL